MIAPGPLAVGIGAQKCGTTSVWQVLHDQPWFDAAMIKETNYFSHRYDLGADWYRAQFPSAAPGRVRGEVSVNYLGHPEAPARIRAHDPDVRLFVVLRDPVERAVSAHFHAVRDGWPGAGQPFEVLLERAAAARSDRAIPPMLGDGSYHRHLVRYLEHFPAEQLLVLFLEELTVDPGPHLARLFRHLGAPPDATVPLGGLPHENAYRVPRLPVLQRALVRQARRAAHRGRTRLSRDLLLAERALGRPAARQQRPDVPGATRAALRAFYAEDDAALADLLGRPLPW